MASTVTTFDFALKRRYTDKKVEDLTMEDKPFYAMVAKNTEFSGSATVVPLIHINAQGIAGSTRAVAQTNQTNVVGKTFLLTNGKYHGSVYIGDEVLEASRNNPGAFLDNKTAEVDSLYEQMSQDLALYLYSNGGNALGRRASISGNIVTLTNSSDVANFEVGMTVVASTGDGSDVSHALLTGSTTVASVERSSGTVTLTSAAALLLFANNDYLFRQGDFFGNTGVVVMKGISAYIWSSDAPPALYGMTRTSDPTRLAGCRVPSAETSGKSIEERLQLLGAWMTGVYRAPGPDALFLHPLDWQALAIALQSSGIRPLEDDSTRFGFNVLNWAVGGKTVKVYNDPFCPRNTGFALRMQHWRLHSMGKLLHPIEKDGLTLLRGAAVDEYEYRLISYPVLECNAPGNNGRVGFS